MSVKKKSINGKFQSVSRLQFARFQPFTYLCTGSTELTASRTRKCSPPDNNRKCRETS